MLLTIKFLPFLASTSYFLYKFPNTTDEEEKNFEYSSHKFLNLLLLPMFMIIENGLVDLLSNPTYAFVYKRKILFGLIISAVADILIIHDFMVGLVLFALVHMLYISALGFKPLKPALGLVCLLIQSGFSIFFLNHFTDKLLQIAAPLYGLLLLCMVWRACSKLDYNVLRVLLALGKPINSLFSLQQ